MQPRLLEYILLVKNYGRILVSMHCDELSEMVQNVIMAIFVLYLGLLTYWW